MTFEAYARERLPALVGLARALCADRHLAEDLVQDVLIKLHARWDVVGALPARDAYVRRMIVNELFSWRRRWARVVAHPDPLAAGRAPAADDGTSQRAERADLLADLRALPPRQRAVLALRYYEDLDDAEIADLLGCARSTVRVHAARALTALRVARADAPADLSEGGPPDA